MSKANINPQINQEHIASTKFKTDNLLNHRIIKLSKSYPSRYGSPHLSKIDTRIFSESYFAHCIKCNFCLGSCCYYGAEIDFDNVERVDQLAGDLESYLKIPRDDWFQKEFRPCPEYPGEAFTRTKVVDGACVFLDKTQKNCGLHRYCLERGIDYHIIKPIICSTFPLTFDAGLLFPVVEVEEKTLRCLGDGETLYSGIRDDLGYYWGADLVDELDRLMKTLVSSEHILSGLYGSEG